MHVFGVYDGTDVNVPPSMGQPREDQMQGTPAEQLIEVAGRSCYDSMGNGRPSGEYHKNLLLEQKHYSVAEHVHWTIEVQHMSPLLFVGMPDLSVAYMGRLYNSDHWRITGNLRHCLEWPDNVTMRGVEDLPGYKDTIVHKRDVWNDILKAVAWNLCPSVFPKPASTRAGLWTLVKPATETECFVSLFLEDSRVFSHEMVRHRGNISQRSGRFVDEINRPDRVHPDLRDYLNEVGFLRDVPAGSTDIRENLEALGRYAQEAGTNKPYKSDRKKGESEEPLFEGGSLDPVEAESRSRLGDRIGEHQVASKMLYKAVVDRLQPWLMQKRSLDKVAARKQARSAARYYLGNGLSTEMVFTASIRHWRHIFGMRVTPHADAAIREVMSEAQNLVAASQYGHLL